MREELTRQTGRPELYQMSARIEQHMQAKKGLLANVDFYSAIVYFSLGIPIDLFTPVFAMSRVALEPLRTGPRSVPAAHATGGAEWIPRGSHARSGVVTG